MRAGPFWKGLGPGLVSGASDNDPTTVATLAVVGATTTYGLAWLVLLVIPMLMTVQSIAAQVGSASRRGLQASIRIEYGRSVALATLVGVVATNVVTLAADLEGGGAALQLIVGIDYRAFVVPMAAAIGAVMLTASPNRLANALRYVCAIFLAYVVVAVVARPDWAAVARGSLVPHVAFSKAYAADALALLGTTLTSYVYFGETYLSGRREPGPGAMRSARIEAAAGIGFSGVVFYFIVIATGATLGVHHEQVATAADAAAALVPVAGRFAGRLFGIGLLGSALVAIPVLAGTCASTVAESVDPRRDANRSQRTSAVFRGTLLAALALGCIVALAGIPPVTLLFVSGVIAGFVTPFTLALLMLVARNRNVMASHAISRRASVAGWLVTAIVGTSAAVYLTSILGHGR